MCMSIPNDTGSPLNGSGSPFQSPPSGTGWLPSSPASSPTSPLSPSALVPLLPLLSLFYPSLSAASWWWALFLFILHNFHFLSLSFLITFTFLWIGLHILKPPYLIHTTKGENLGGELWEQKEWLHRLLHGGPEDHLQGGYCNTLVSTVVIVYLFFRMRRSCCWGACSPCWSLACTSSSSSGLPYSTQGPLLLAWSSPVSWYITTH